MSIWQTFLGWFKDDGTLPLDACVGELAAEVWYKELAIQSCINLIANTIALAEFKTYDKGVEVRKDNYYLLNVEPNPNKNASKFWRDVITRLIYDNECLVIQEGGFFYAAESFDVTKFAFKDYVFSNIVIDGYQLKETKISPEVFHFELHDEKIKTVIDGLYSSYSELIAASQSHYKRNNARRGKLKVPTDYPQTDAAQEDLQDLLGRRFKRFFEAEGGAVIPLTSGLDYEELTSNIGVKGGIEGRDIRAFIDDIFDMVAIAFQVPTALLRGNVSDTDKAINNFLMFCINPLAEILTDEINRKLYAKTNYLQRSYIRLDTSHIKVVDIKDVANALDVLLRIGAYSIDDCLVTLGMEPLNTSWSKARWMTKNYETVEKSFEGGG